jgi:hypothetical protein
MAHCSRTQEPTRPKQGNTPDMGIIKRKSSDAADGESVNVEVNARKMLVWNILLVRLLLAK